MTLHGSVRQWSDSIRAELKGHAAGILWLRLAHLDAADQPECVSTAVRATAADTDEDIADVAADETVTRGALELLASKRNDAYETALAGIARGHPGLVG
jgi:hypothetical protein